MDRLKINVTGKESKLLDCLERSGENKLINGQDIAIAGGQFVLFMNFHIIEEIHQKVSIEIEQNILFSD